jgi:hypothetical protein
MLIRVLARVWLARWARKQAPDLRLSENLPNMKTVRPKAQAVSSCEKHPNWNTVKSEPAGLAVAEGEDKEHRNATPAAPTTGVHHGSDVARFLAAPAFAGALGQPLLRVPPPEEIRASPPRARGRPQPR